MSESGETSLGSVFERPITSELQNALDAAVSVRLHITRAFTSGDIAEMTLAQRQALSNELNGTLALLFPLSSVVGGELKHASEDRPETPLDAAASSPVLIDPVVVQIGAFLKRFAMTLDEVASGATYRIAAHNKARADLVALDPAIHHPDLSVSRKVLRGRLSAHLLRVHAGETILVSKRGAEGGVVLLKPPVDNVSDPPTKDERRKASRERSRRRRGRADDEIAKRHREFGLDDREKRILEITEGYSPEDIASRLDV